MKTTIGELCTYLESIAPLSLQETYDNAGLITGSARWEVKGILISLDATEEIIDEAIQKNCNLVISHHPIVFRGLKKIQGSHYVERSIIKAIKNDIALYAIHTNLDNVLNYGVSQKIAEKLNLQNLRILQPRNSFNLDEGAGVIGDLNKGLSLQNLLSLVKTTFSCGIIRHTRDLNKNILKVAVCGGSGAFLIPRAIESGADAYLTADIKYHEFFEANNEMVILDIGHFESEQFTIELLYGLISKKYSNFASHCTKTNTNPVQYY